MAWCVAQVDASRIDAWNIYQASRQAMTDAVARLSVQPDFLLIDAMHLDLLVEQKPIVKGDARSVSIAAASILAKVARDQVMREFDRIYPQYGLASNKGYATRSSGSAAHAWPFAAAPILFRAGAQGGLLGRGGDARGPSALSPAAANEPGVATGLATPPVTSANAKRAFR